MSYDGLFKYTYFKIINNFYDNLLIILYILNKHLIIIIIDNYIKFLDFLLKLIIVYIGLFSRSPADPAGAKRGGRPKPPSERSPINHGLQRGPGIGASLRLH